jgi:hypothetical protein
VHGGDFRGEGRATGPNGETSTEAAGKTYKDEVSVDGTGHTSVVISVKLQKMLEVQLKMLAAVNKTNDQLEKVEVAIRRQRVLPPAPPPPVWNRSNRPYTVTIEKFIYVATLCRNNFRPKTVTIEKFIYVNCSNTSLKRHRRRIHRIVTK